MPEQDYKRCTLCSEEKPLEDFYANRKMRDGRSSWCKACTSARNSAHAKKHRDRYSAYSRRSRKKRNEENPGAESEYRRQWERENRGKTRAKASRYAKRHPEKRIEWAKAHLARHPEKARARKAVSNAVRSGTIVKPDACEDCGKTFEDARKLHGHHEDYSKPLDVNWLCKDCHQARHT